MAVTELGLAHRRARVSDLFELTKPRITFMVLLATLVGFYMGSGENLQTLLLLHTIVGTGLVAAGASSFNQYLERDLDSRMVRTRTRPIPDVRTHSTVFLGTFIPSDLSEKQTFVPPPAPARA